MELIRQAAKPAHIEPKVHDMWSAASKVGRAEPNLAEPK